MTPSRGARSSWGPTTPVSYTQLDVYKRQAGDDEDRVWRWGFVERVTTGLYLPWFGSAEESGRFLATAALLAAHYDCLLSPSRCA